RAPLPRTRHPALDDRPDPLGQPHHPLHPLRHPRLQMPRRPTPTPRPYYQWTAKINGKTVTRRLNQTEAELYQEWIDNDRQLRHVIQQMREVAAKATELKLKQAATP